MPDFSYQITSNSQTPPPHHSTLHWQWHPAMAPRPLPQNWSSPSPPTIAHYNGTQQWHHVHCTLQWHPGATSNPPKWFVALPPIGSKNPYSYGYLGNNSSQKTTWSHVCIMRFDVLLGGNNSWIKQHVGIIPIFQVNQWPLGHQYNHHGFVVSGYVQKTFKCNWQVYMPQKTTKSRRHWPTTDYQW